ncbi:hypothetical protein Hdeb2414_s0006g00211531 [Helianthus debilis subsp. tardiflorus]
MATNSKMVSIFLFIFMTIVCTKVLAQCEVETNNPCNNKSKALPLKIIGIAALLITSIIGVCLPLITRSIPALSPDRSRLVIFLGSFLADNPWHKFPFTGFFAMLSTIFTLMVDSMATSMYKSKNNAIAAEGGEVVTRDQEMAGASGVVHSIVIGLGVEASNDVCTIKPLFAALCLHQMFEGMGLGGCILQVLQK